ncbi:MAG: hypothetical protein JXA11_14065 [Phycisphaerae bacterium]|nr:hypothetical protein [Phycisphaerae bacterium]
MTHTNHRRDVRIVGYDKRLLFAQMQMLAAVLVLPAVALSHGWIAAVLGVLFFLLTLSVFVQLWRLRTTGLVVTLEEIPSEESAEEVQADDETPDIPLVEETPEPIPASEPAEPEPHWADVAYPDPDVELGLTDDLREEPEVHWSQSTYPDPDEQG